MNKGPSTAAQKTPSALTTKSAWANGPPQSASSASSPRSQSPAPSQIPSQSHSRRPSQLGSFKDAVGVGIAGGSRGNVPKTTNPINFGTVNGSPSDKLPPSSSPPVAALPVAKSESRPVQSFGSIEATQTSQTAMSSTAKPSAASNPPATSSSATSSAGTIPATDAQKRSSKFDVSMLFRGGGGDTKTSSPVNSSFPESVASPPMRSNTLSPAVPPPPNQNGPGPAGPGPHPQAHPQAHPHQPPPQSYPPPFVPAAMRNPSGGNGPPRSPSFPRAVPNGAGVRPPVNSGPPGPNGSNMPSPRLAPPQAHVQHQHQHQHQQQPPTVPQGMPPPVHAVPGWPGYYYPYVPGMPMQSVPEHYMHYPPQHWHMQPPQHPHQPPSGTSGPPQTPLSHSHGLPMSSPRPSQPPLQPPGTPPAGMATPLPSAGARLNSNASAFVPSHAPLQQRQNKVKITDASGHEVDLSVIRKQGATPSAPPSSTSSTPTNANTSDKNGRRATTVRLETEEARLKRIAEEARKQKEKDKEEREKQEKKEAEERKRREAQEKAKAEEEEAQIKAEEDRKRKEEEERRRKEEEEERAREEEEERKRKEEAEKERLRKEEDERERVRKEEEERKRKEEEEARRREEELRRRKEDEEKRRKKDEEERLRKEAEDKERVQKEEEAEAIARTEVKLEKPKPAPLEIKSKKEGQASSTVTDAPVATSPETSKRRPIPGPLDLSAAHKPVSQPLPSALATARHIQDVYQVPYPEGIKSPKPELNTNAKDGKFRYDRDFLLQFMSVCREKPDNLPPLEAIGLEPVDQSHTMGRVASGRRGIPGSMGPPSGTAARQSSIGLGFNINGKVGSGFAMGNFAAPKLTSEERFMRSSSMSGGPGSLAFGGGRPSPMVRSSSQGGPGASGSKRTRSKRGDATRNESNRINAVAAQAAANVGFEPVAPLEHSVNRWVAGSTMRRAPQPVDPNSPEIVEKKVRALLNKLTMEKFDSISNQIIEWANKSENEKDGRTLIQVIRLVFEKATDEAAWSEMYARLCRKMMEQISPNVMDEGIRNAEGKPITGGLLFRKYLLNRCQEDFERGWSNKETTAAAALVKAKEDKAVQDANEKNKEAGGDVMLYSDEYYAAQKAKRQGLGLIKFIGELFKLQMLTERIMHECIKKLLSNVDNPEEEEIESLCKLLTTVGQALDTSKARGHMDVYFSRMKELAKSSNVAPRMQFMLQDVIELRERKWIPRNASQAPTTLAQVHESAAKEKAQQEQHNLARSAISRGGSRRGHERDGGQVGPDGWAVASGPSRPTNKAGDLTNFGKIQKGSGATVFGPASVFTKKGDNKRDSATLSRVSSNTNMFQMLDSAGSEPAAAAAAASSRASRSTSRHASVDLSQNPPTEPAAPAQRPKLNLLPRTKPLADKSEASPAESRADEDAEEGEIVERDSGRSSLLREQAEKKVEQDRKEFFAIRDLDEGEEYFSSLPSEHRHLLVQKFVLHALEAKEADAKLVAELFERAISRNLCSPASFEEGFMPAAEALDDIAIDAPKAFSLMATMMKGAKLDEERRTRIASKSVDSEKLLALLF